MDTEDRFNEPVPPSRNDYDPGPSGTAVAGLIIALIALAVGLYAAFAPRDTVREVQTGFEQSMDARDPSPAETRGERAPSDRGAVDTAERWGQQISQEFQEQTQALRQELNDLRQRMDNYDRREQTGGAETPGSQP